MRIYTRLHAQNIEGQGDSLKWARERNFPKEKLSEGLAYLSLQNYGESSVSRRHQAARISMSEQTMVPKQEVHFVLL